MKLGKVGLLGSLLVSPTVALAEEAAKDSVTNRDVKFSTEVRMEMIHNDNGKKKTEGYEPDADTSVYMGRFKVQFRGNLDRDVEYRLRFDAKKLGDDDGDALEYGWIKWNATKMFSISAGQDKVAQNGVYEKMDKTYRFHKPFNVKGVSSYAKMVAFHMKAAGKITLQVFDDPNRPDAENDWSNDKEGTHPTFAAQWAGKFGDIQPLVQLGAYDNQKSNWLSLGTKYKFGGLHGYFNYQMTNHNTKFQDGDEAKDSIDILSSIELEVNYDVTKKITGFAYVNLFDVKNSTEGGAEDTSYNVTDFGEDKSTQLALGVQMQETEKLKTFAGVKMKMGSFFVSQDDAGKVKEEDRTNTEIYVGMGLKI